MCIGFSSLWEKHDMEVEGLSPEDTCLRVSGFKVSGPTEFLNNSAEV